MVDWFWGMFVVVVGEGESVGTFGWSGGLGTSWACDPGVGSAGILLAQRAMTSPEPPAWMTRFWDGVHDAA